MRRTAWLAALLTLPPLVPLLVWPVAGDWRFPALLPGEWSLRAPRMLLDAELLDTVLASGGIGLAVAVLSVALALPAGKALGERDFTGRARTLAVVLLLLPILVPPLAVVLGIHVTFIQLGLADTVVGVCLVHLVPAVPYATLVLAAAFAAHGGEQEAAAQTLGASPWRAFWHVTLPALTPALAVAGLLAFLISWGQYLLTVVIGGGLVVTLPMRLFAAASGSDPAATATLALIAAAPALAALPLVMRYAGPARAVTGAAAP